MAQVFSPTPHRIALCCLARQEVLDHAHSDGRVSPTNRVRASSVRMSTHPEGTHVVSGHVR
jgi:hypothetical protein